MALYGSVINNLNFSDVWAESLRFVFEALHHAFFTSTKIMMYCLTAFVLFRNICFFLKQNKFTIGYFYFCNVIIIGVPGAMLMHLLNFVFPGNGSGIY